MATRSSITRHTRLKNQAGGETVEFALVAVLFFTVLFAIIEFGLVMYNQQVVTNAGREAARYGIVARPVGYKETSADIEQIARSYAETFIVSFGPKNFQVESNQCAGFGDELTVRVNYDYSFFVLPGLLRLLNGVIPQGLGLETRAVMRCE